MNTPTAWAVRAGTLRRTAAPADTATPTHDTVLIRTRYTALCGSDTAKLLPGWHGPTPDPWFPGHEIVGVDPRNGDWVVVNPLVGCRACHECAKGRTQLCQGLRRIGWDLPGGLAESVRVPVSSVVRLPAGLADPAHGVLADPMAVALHGVRCGLRLRTSPGRLGVIGTGPLGICTAVYAASVGWDVHVTARSAARREELSQALDGSGVMVHDKNLPSCDAVIDAASGHDDSPLLQAVESVRDGGTVVVQNAYAPPVTLSLPLRALFRRSITVRGSFSYCRADDRDDFGDALRLIARGGAWAGALTRDRFPLLDLPQGLSALRRDARRPLKVLLTSNT
ncbi:zinc-dependent alcohol dehydrogenase [Streptomyces sp. NPDC005151]